MAPIRTDIAASQNNKDINLKISGLEEKFISELSNIQNALRDLTLRISELSIPRSAEPDWPRKCR